MPVIHCRSRRRFAPSRLAVRDVQPFIDAEEAWFWFIHAQRTRSDGGRFRGGAGGPGRPCDPDDIYRAVMALHRRRLLGRDHLNVLATYGMGGCPPDPRIPDQARAHALWQEALDRLTTVLKSKAIIDAG